MLVWPPRKEPIYCKHCGRKLIPDDTVSSYDEQTGEPITPFLNRKVCPNRSCPAKQARDSWPCYP